ncbi:transcription termination factor MTEF18, mitochondrial-like [Andrographis paniculata]|uniref:transcription termination factor MTEF18, mitochondrial-like n=1 Tax=Andrographis paniculata TaxID=175694 RepID=UPI0021E98295|nr:transcription termination factor MTEF18, mitochondrial-like [Andrographis paniculata]XP_051142145.1 transcription termination factor MTEF18, mitochondrial-like [Andrographis paniculata]XP_051142152.1 transcription termination factor MTEF18, mitochondrial-like [Andrographis paniculata]
MTGFHKLRSLNSLSLKLCRRSDIYGTSSEPQLYVNGLRHTWHFIRLFRAQRADTPEFEGNRCELPKKSVLATKHEAQAAFMEYLHTTRNLRFTDAENMSKNASDFLDGLLQRVEIDAGDVGGSLARFLRYHPVNEFEPFFESIGLKPSEYASFLPRNLMFLNDDQFLLQNYYTLCNYGVRRDKIGRIYKEARDLFRHDSSILKSRLGSFELLGLEQFLVAKIITSSPYLLRGDSNKEFLEFLEKLKNIGIGYDWLAEHIHEGSSYSWKCMLELMCLLTKMGLNEDKVGEVIIRHPGLLFEGSGRFANRIVGMLLKFGSTQSDIQTMFLQFPDLSAAKFVNNLGRCYKLLVKIRMPVEDIGWIFRSYPLLLGSCEVREFHSMRCALNCGRERLRQMVMDDPTVLKKWVIGVRIERPPEMKRILKVKILRTKFLLNLGFVEKSKEMEKAIKALRGKAGELQERFDYLVNAGLSRQDAIRMVKVYPEIINQSTDSIAAKIDCFVRDLGYPLSDLVTHPRLLSYTIPRLKLRLLTYRWLKNEGAVNPNLTLSSIFACSNDTFLRCYVKSHSGGREIWERLKEELYSHE